MSPEAFTLLQKGLEKCVGKKDRPIESSLAYTKDGRCYVGALIESETHLLTIPPEQVALMLAIVHNDFPVRQIITLKKNNDPFSLSPLTVKILVDYVMRTQQSLSYQVCNLKKELLFETQDVTTLFPLYKPTPVKLSRTSSLFSSNKEYVGSLGEALPTQLKTYALKGLTRNFPTHESASGYGSAVYTKSGMMYYAGQYSSPDKRLNLHAEMTALLSALMDEAQDIEHIGIVSTKFLEHPCNMCGMCRQFIAEMATQFQFSPTLWCFAKERNDRCSYSLETYLPSLWTSKTPCL